MTTMTAGVTNLGLYSIADAARYARIPTTTVRRWMERQDRGTTWREHLVSFDDLISLLFVHEFREHDVKLREIMRAEADLRERFDWGHPFVHQGLWTAGGDILIKMPGGADHGADAVIAANRGGQVASSIIQLKTVQLPELVRNLEDQLNYEDQRVAAWRPADDVVARPATQFGLTCIEGTRIPTRSIYQAIAGGDTPAQLARLYEVDEKKIERAAEWERQLAA
jgi:uncharacterized protein (DUF433 family)